MVTAAWRPIVAASRADKPQAVALDQGNAAAVCSLAQQRLFFRAQVQTWVEASCGAVQARPRAAVGSALAEVTRRFVMVQTQAFDLLES